MDRQLSIEELAKIASRLDDWKSVLQEQKMVEGRKR